jgi:hypothetical protein
MNVISANLVIPHSYPDDGDRASLRNVGIWLNSDTADRPRKFYNYLNCYPELKPEKKFSAWCGQDLHRDRYEPLVSVAHAPSSSFIGCETWSVK